MSKVVAPAITLKSFSCPHCGALAAQSWFATCVDRLNEPPTFDTADELRQVEGLLQAERDTETKKTLTNLRRRAEGDLSGKPYLYGGGSGRSQLALRNLHVSVCFSCHEVTVWRHDQILYPPTRHAIEPNADLPPDIRADFDEARAVLDTSPKSAAALLRLCIQKLCKVAGEPGENINTDIGSLVKKGLDARVQKALDLVRVVGNNAVHPGTLDLNDNREIAAKLFELVNRVAYDLITHPRELDALYDQTIPAGAKDAIVKRDAPKPKP